MNLVLARFLPVKWESFSWYRCVLGFCHVLGDSIVWSHINKEELKFEFKSKYVKSVCNSIMSPRSLNPLWKTELLVNIWKAPNLCFLSVINWTLQSICLLFNQSPLLHICWQHFFLGGLCESSKLLFFHHLHAAWSRGPSNCSSSLCCYSASLWISRPTTSRK